MGVKGSGYLAGDSSTSRLLLENSFLNQMLLFPLTSEMTGTSLKVLKVAPK